MVTPEELAQVLEYKDGKVYWKIKVSRKIIPGKEAGSPEGKGYWAIRYKTKLYKAHRVVWCLCKGEWPTKDKEIDHINQNKLDNRIENLRVVDRKTNARNKKHRGYRKRGNRYYARIRVDGKEIHLGAFDTSEEAARAYYNAKVVYHDYGKTKVQHHSH